MMTAIMGKRVGEARAGSCVDLLTSMTQNGGGWRESARKNKMPDRPQILLSVAAPRVMHTMVNLYFHLSTTPYI